MIPKIIHYCWFGKNAYSEKMKVCMESWKKYCSDYEFVCWNEENFDVNMNEFVRTAYKKKKWAFVSDYVRLWAIYNYGGFYLDTDVELIKPLDTLRENRLFLCCQEGKYINTGLGFGAEPFSLLIYKNMLLYEKMGNNSMGKETDEFLVKPCPLYTTELIIEEGIQFPITEIIKKEELVIYPAEYFDPFDSVRKKIKVTKNTIGIHHYEATWMTKEQKVWMIEQEIYQRYKKRYGKKVADIWSYFYWCRKVNGGKGVLKSLVHKIKK